MNEKDTHMVDPFSSTYTRMEWLELKGTRSKRSKHVPLAAVNAWDYFCKDEFKGDNERISDRLKKDYKKTGHAGLSLRYIQRFATWLHEPHPSFVRRIGRHKVETPFKGISSPTIPQYLSQLKSYFLDVLGITINDSQFNRIKIPEDEFEEQEPKPLTKQMLKEICDNTARPKTRTMYMVQKDTTARIGETVQLRKRHFDFAKDPVEVNFPASILKKKRRRSKFKVLKRYLTRETAARVRLLVNKLEDGDLVFGSNENVEAAINNEEEKWRNLMDNLGAPYNERDPRGRLAFVIHSIRSFGMTAISEAVSESFAHAYADHTPYLGQYIRLTETEKIAKFRKAESKLSIYNIQVVVDHTDEEVNELKKEVKFLKWTLTGLYCEKCTNEKFSQISK